LPQKHLIGDDKENSFYVKSTYAKYILGEESTEVGKLREIRALKNVRLLRIDRVPTYFDFQEVFPTNLHSITQQDCFSMPGVALKRNEHYYVDLSDDQIFRANKDYTYFISHKLRENLDVLFKDPTKEAVQFEKPLEEKTLSLRSTFRPRIKSSGLTKKRSHWLKKSVALKASTANSLARKSSAQDIR
jgi:hypothetical protein